MRARRVESAAMKNAALLVLALMAPFAACRKAEQAAPGKTPTPPSAAAPSPAASAEESASQAAAGVDVGSMMPEYSSMSLDGSRFDLASRRGNVVLVNVWATWCPPCRAEIPELQALHDKYVDQKFEVVGISVDEAGADTVKQFVQEHKMTYPVALDSEGKIAELLQTSVLPTSVLLDRSGKIVWKKFGAVMPNDRELEQALDAAL